MIGYNISVTLWGQGGWAKYRNSENFKAASRVFCGVKIAPLPLPALFPRAAAPSGTRYQLTRLWASMKVAVCVNYLGG